MFKRFLALTLAAVMVLSIAVSCRSDDPAPQPETPPVTQPETPPVTQPETPTAGFEVEDPDTLVIRGALGETIANLRERFPAGTPTGVGVGGVLNYAQVSANPFTGIHNPIFSLLAPDGEINDFMFTGLLSVYDNNFYNHNGPAWFEYDRGEQVRDADGNIVEVITPATFTVHFHDDTAMYWWDGVPVTMYDVAFAYEVMAYPGLYSDRFGPAQNTSTVLGIAEYQEDPSIGISGIRVFNNGRSIEFSYESMSPTHLIGAVWTTPIPRHHFEGISPLDMENHPNSRTNPLGNGAFMFSHSVPGESISLVANPNFWAGAPALDGINISVIHPDMVGEAMLIGAFDLASMPMLHVPSYEHRLTNASLISALDRRLDFMGFRHGQRDENYPRSIRPNEDSYINCVHLRRALGYARDDITTTEMLFNGFRFPISTTVVPWQGVNLMNQDIDGFLVFNLEKANQILDDAGYEWRAGEDFRRHNVTGEPFEIVWLIANNFTENYEKVPHHMQNWASVGLNVVLFEGRLVTLAERSEILNHDTDNGAVHIYDATWLVGSNPNPNSLWGDSVHNAARYYSPEFFQILDNINSEDAWDLQWFEQQFHDFQQYVYDQATWIPVSTAVLLWVANDRVLNFSLDRSVVDTTLPGNARWHLWDLSSSTPYTAR